MAELRQVPHPRPPAGCGVCRGHCAPTCSTTAARNASKKDAPWIRPKRSVLPAVVARPVAHHAPLRAGEEGRVPSDELPVEAALGRAWDGESWKTPADRLDDLQHVFAGQLHHEWHYPRLARRHNLLKVPLTDLAITVPGVQAVQNYLLSPGQGWPLRIGARLLVVDARWDGDGLALHLDLEWHRRCEPGLRHDRQDALHVTGKTGRKRCLQSMGDVRRIPRQLHSRRIGAEPLGLATARLNVAGQPLDGSRRRQMRGLAGFDLVRHPVLLH